MDYFQDQLECLNDSLLQTENFQQRCDYYQHPSSVTLTLHSIPSPAPCWTAELTYAHTDATTAVLKSQGQCMLSLHTQAACTYMYDYKPVFRGQTFPSLYSRSSVSWMSVYTWVLPAEPCTTGWPGQISPDTHQWVSLSSLSVPPPPSSVDHTPPPPHPVETVPAGLHLGL